MDRDRLWELSEDLRVLSEKMKAAARDGGEPTAQIEALIKMGDAARHGHLVALDPENAPNQVGKMLRVFRETVGIPQRQVAELIGKGDHRSVRRYEQGETNQGIVGLAEHAQALGGVAILGIYAKDHS